jgi:carbamoyl-phosphate synthase large subunit
MKPTVLVLGSGPIRIGQGIEFDYSCVHCIWALQELGYRAIILNNNPETVSTDFDTGDGLYFEPVTLESVLDVAHIEKPVGTVVQFGGQTAINLAEPLAQMGMTVLGTPPQSIADAEDRDRFEHLLASLGVPKPPGRAVRSLEEAVNVAAEIGYPVLVRPSFVLGGRAMEIVFSEGHLKRFYREAEDANPGQPVLVDRYFSGVEAEVDVISDGEETLVPGIMEHIERAGVHSGDSMAAYPPVSLSPEVKAQMVRAACDIARALKIKGMMNIQFVIVDETAYVLEVNPRASRTVPYISKVTGVPMVKLATRCMMGRKLRDDGYIGGLWTLDDQIKEALPFHGGKRYGATIPEECFRGDNLPNPTPKIYAVKAPVFSFQKLGKVEPSLGPEMKSTGEILGIDRTFEGALYKALVASNISFRPKGSVIVSVDEKDKDDAVAISQKLSKKGYQLAGTPGTAKRLQAEGIECQVVNKIGQGSPTLIDLLFDGEVSLMINTPGPEQHAESDAAKIRRACIETGVACITNVDTAKAIARALDFFENPETSTCHTLTEYLSQSGSA